MAIALRGVGALFEETVAATTHAVAYPASIAAGDVLVLAGGTSSGSGSATAVTTPGGWTLVKQAGSTGNTVTPTIAVFIKVAAGTETGTLTVTTTSNITAFQILAFTGVDNTTPQDVTATFVDSTTIDTTTVIPAATVVTAGAALVAVGSKNATTGTATPPSTPATFTETGDRSTGSRGIEVSYLLGVATGSTGTPTITWTVSARSLGVMVVLRPDPGILPELVMPPRR